MLALSKYAYTTGYDLGTATETITYTYGDSAWGDLLTKFDGESITYDTIGNPTSYYNGTRWTFGWEHGRQLASATDGTTSITYTYDGNGMRHTKTVDGVVYTYYYVGDKLVRETFGETVMDFFYDQNGQPYAVKYNGLMLYYILNQQGDVEKLVTNAGVSYGVYRYDAWGNILYQTNNQYLNANPLRYRGYVYDQETGLYYLQSRYYDPAIGRFINADALVSTGQGILGNNMFAYCRNNPVNMVDTIGNLPQWIEDLWADVKDFFSPTTGSISETYTDDNNNGYVTVTSGYSDFSITAIGQDELVDKKYGTYEQDGFMGINGELSVVNVSAGLCSKQNDYMSLSLTGSADAFALTGYTGFQYKNGLGVVAGAHAAALSGTVSADFDICGWGIIVGATGDVGSLGIVGAAGFVNGVASFSFRASAGIGGGFFVKVKIPDRYY